MWKPKARVMQSIAEGNHLPKLFSVGKLFLFAGPAMGDLVEWFASPGRWPEAQMGHADTPILTRSCRATAALSLLALQPMAVTMAH